MVLLKSTPVGCSSSMGKLFGKNWPSKEFKESLSMNQTWVSIHDLLGAWPTAESSNFDPNASRSTIKYLEQNRLTEITRISQSSF